MRIFITSIATALLLHSAASHADDTASLIQAGDRFHASFQNVEALKQYKMAHEADPDNFEAMMKTIAAYVNSGEDMDSKESGELYEQAVELANTMAEKFPDRAESFYYVALASGRLAQFRGGKEKVKLSRNIEQNAKKSLKMNPDQFRAHLLLGVYNREVANLNWFLKKFAKAFFGGLPEGSNEDSVKHLKRAIELNPDYLRSHFELAKTYEAMSDKEKSIAELEKVGELSVIDHLDEKYKEKARALLKKLGAKK